MENITIGQILGAVKAFDEELAELGVCRENSLQIEETIGHYFIELSIGTIPSLEDEE
jgi:hypothetical protein